MKISVNRLVAASLICLFAAFLHCGSAKASAKTEKLYDLGSNEESALQTEMPKNYSSLAGLVSIVCDDAIEQFYNFFSPALVNVEPFLVLGEFPANRRISLLGATLADQMTAMINNSPPLKAPAGNEDYEQRVQGILQEIDGLLRIHISGVNSDGERRSYVINVEMSEPIYRALHTYVGQ